MVQQRDVVVKKMRFNVGERSFETLGQGWSVGHCSPEIAAVVCGFSAPSTKSITARRPETGVIVRPGLTLTVDEIRASISWIRGGGKAVSGTGGCA